MSDTIITLNDFLIKCYKRERYIGHVIGLGYVSAWKTERVSMDHPINNPYAFVGNAQFSHTIEVPVITPILQVNNRNSEYTDKGKVASWGSTAATAGTIINKALVMEPKYIRVNPQGTMIRNPNFGKAKIGTAKISGGLGWGFLGFSVYYDYKAYTNKEISREEMWIDIGVNGVIFTIGLACPALGVVLGILYMTITAGTGPGANASYEEIHGSITPADNTRVYIPKKELPRRQEIPLPAREYPVLKPSKNR